MLQMIDYRVWLLLAKSGPNDCFALKNLFAKYGSFRHQ